MYEGARRWASVCIQGDMLIWEVSVIKGNTLTDHVPSVACTSCTVGHMERWALCWARVCIEPGGAVLV